MSASASPFTTRVAIACGGTGGHLFPGVAVGRELLNRGVAVTLFVSSKEVDRQAVAQLPPGFEIEVLPAVGLSRGRALASVIAAWRSGMQARRLFRSRPVNAVLAMGGFTSFPVALAGRWCGATTFLHESNTIPGRANRWLAPWVSACFVGFSEAASRLKNRNTTVTGTPVRAGFVPTDPAAARIALGFRPDQPLLVVIGGSQGAEGVNRLVVQSLPALLEAMPDLQVFHVTGNRDFESVTTAFASFGDRVRVTPFHQGMDVALAAATVAVSRSGASSLAEFAAMRVPAILIPFPAATDDHQRVNAQAMVQVGASRMLEQRTASVSDLVNSVRELISDEAVRSTMIQSLSALDAPGAAGRIAEQILTQSGVLASAPASRPSGESRSNRRSVGVGAGVDVTRTRETLA